MADRRPKYLQVRETILAQIRTGELKPGDKLPVRQELLHTFQVARTTLDRALKGLIDSGVLNSAKRGGTVVATPSARLKTVGVVSRLSKEAIYRHHGVPNDLEMMFTSMILAANGRVHLAFKDEAEILKSLRAIDDYDGVIWVQPDEVTMDSLAPYRHKVIVTNRYSETLNFVSTHHRQATADITDYFLRHAPADAQVFFLHAERSSFPYKERLEGFISTCETHQRFYRLVALSHDHDQALETLLALRFEPGKALVLVSMSNFSTFPVEVMAVQRGLILGETLFYGDFDYARPALGGETQSASIVQNYADMGYAAIEGILHLDQHPCQEYIPYTIVGQAASSSAGTALR